VFYDWLPAWLHRDKDGNVFDMTPHRYNLSDPNSKFRLMYSRIAWEH